MAAITLAASTPVQSATTPVSVPPEETIKELLKTVDKLLFRIEILEQFLRSKLHSCLETTQLKNARLERENTRLEKENAQLKKAYAERPVKYFEVYVGNAYYGGP